MAVDRIRHKLRGLDHHILLESSIAVQHIHWQEVLVAVEIVVGLEADSMAVSTSQRNSQVTRAAGRARNSDATVYTQHRRILWAVKKDTERTVSALAFDGALQLSEMRFQTFKRVFLVRCSTEMATLIPLSLRANHQLQQIHVANLKSRTNSVRFVACLMHRKCALAYGSAGGDLR